MGQYEIIQHHGVKGMRWGVRKVYNNFKTKMSNKRIKIEKGGNNKKNTDKEIIKSSKGSVRKIKRMTDDEIRQKIERLNIENNLKRLSSNLRDRQSRKIYKQRKLYTNDELTKLNNRLQLEDTLRQQTSLKKAKTRIGMFAESKKIMAEVAMKSAVDYIHDGNLNLSNNLANVTYKSAKANINNSNASDFTKAVSIAKLQKSTGRDRHDNKVKK